MRDQRQLRAVNARIAEIAGRQHGVISREQLMQLGLGKDSIQRRLSSGRLLHLHRSVYGVGHRNRSREAVWMAAVLAGGRGTVLSNRPAGAARAICSSTGRVEVTVPRQKRPNRRILFHHVYVEGFEVDCVRRAQRVIVEVDSWEIHRTRAAFERDREKSRILQAAAGAACRSPTCS